jgi:hypothetical protein
MTKADLQQWEKERKEYLQRESVEYLAKVVATLEERQEVVEWVKDGNSVHDNPWCMADGRGAPMDYIEALRICSS